MLTSDGGGVRCGGLVPPVCRSRTLLKNRWLISLRLFFFCGFCASSGMVGPVRCRWSVVSCGSTTDHGQLTTDERHFTSTMLFSSPNWLASTYLLWGSVTHSPSTMK